MGRYVDGYVIPIKKKNIAKYKKMATIGKKAWLKHGALDYYECVGESLNVPYGIPFTKLCKLKPDETVIFAYIVYKSKAHRDRVNKKVHAEFEASQAANDMVDIVDMKKFSVGGFDVLVRK